MVYGHRWQRIRGLSSQPLLRAASLTWRQTPAKHDLSAFLQGRLLPNCRTHLVLAAIPGRGTGPAHFHFKGALQEATQRRAIDTPLADAGYDVEWVHLNARGEYGICTLIPPTIGRPTQKSPSRHFRRQIRVNFRKPKKRRRCGQRWQVETLWSAYSRADWVKHCMPDLLTARNAHCS